MYVRWSFVLEMVFVFVRDVLLQACDDHESVSLPVHKYSINIQYYIYRYIVVFLLVGMCFGEEKSYVHTSIYIRLCTYVSTHVCMCSVHVNRGVCM